MVAAAPSRRTVPRCCSRLRSRRRGTRTSPQSAARIASSCSGLVFIFLSGVLLAAADLPTYLESRVFWTKMALVAALLVNGTVLVRAERQAASGRVAGLRRLHQASAISLALWFLTTLLGTALPNVG